jgi:hypothetical protein
MVSSASRRPGDDLVGREDVGLGGLGLVDDLAALDHAGHVEREQVVGLDLVAGAVLERAHAQAAFGGGILLAAGADPGEADAQQNDEQHADPHLGDGALAERAERNGSNRHELNPPGPRSGARTKRGGEMYRRPAGL